MGNIRVLKWYILSIFNLLHLLLTNYLLNPVKADGNVNIQFVNQEAGKYQVRLYNYFRSICFPNDCECSKRYIHLFTGFAAAIIIRLLSNRDH